MDDTELREALVEQLALFEECESIAVDNGTKAVQTANAGQIDLVIMDVGLPDVDGLAHASGSTAMLRRAAAGSAAVEHLSGASLSRYPLLRLELQGQDIG